MGKDLEEGMTPAAVIALATGQLGNFMAASLPGGIERQEAEGQRRFVEADMLPIDGVICHNLDKIVALGFVIGKEIVEAGRNRNVFVEAKLPAGWKKKATEHSMWSDLLDEKGRKRAAIFFKAAFYDYKAHIRFVSPFSIDVKCSDGFDIYHDRKEEVTCYGAVIRDGQEIYRTDLISSLNQESYTTHAKLRRQVYEWLSNKFPTWEDPFQNW